MDCVSSAQPQPHAVIRVVVVDDHDFVRAQVTALLDAHPDIDVVGECDDGSGVAELAARTRPDVVVMDLQMPGMSGTEATRRLLTDQPGVKVLILTGSVGRGLVSEVAAAGAAGFVMKGADPQGLVDAVRRLAAGGDVWPEPGPFRP
jgi:DNA-binding NarL/FixJ family response regulator